MNTPSRIANLFSKHKACIAYLTAGDGGIQKTLEAALALIAGGVNMLEIGVPFSDPIADGPVIQRASARALAAGTTLEDILALVRQLRLHTEIPLILFSYLNPILAAGSEFLARAKLAGIDGLLLVDCPLEEAGPIQRECQPLGIDLISVITPATDLTRVQQIDAQASGFLYYACRKGTTGVRNNLPEDFHPKIEVIKAIIHLPLVVGFGIANRDMAETVLAASEGVVVGSYFVKALEDGLDPPSLKILAQNLFPHKVDG